MTETEVHTRPSVKEFFARIPTRIFWSVFIVIFLVFAVFSFTSAGKETPAHRAKAITQQLRCLECEGLSVYQSDTKTSKTISTDVARRVKDGESNKQIFAYYENIYGEYIRLAPTAESGNWLIYVVPAFFVAVLILAIGLSISKKFSSRTRMFFWAATGIVFIIGLGVFFSDSKATEKKAVVAQEKSTQDLLQQAVNESPNNNNLRSLAIIQFAKKNPDYIDALKNFDKAVSFNAKDAESKGYAAYIVFLAGEYDQAKMRADDAIATNGQDTTALFFQGVIYYETPETDNTVKQANTTQANKDFDAVLAAAPDSDFAQQINKLRNP